MANASLNLCNLVSQGMTLNEARKHLEGSKTPEPDTPPEIKRLTAQQKKEKLAVEIEAAGGEIPPMNQSVAKFSEALQAALSEEPEE